MRDIHTRRREIHKREHLRKRNKHWRGYTRKMTYTRDGIHGKGTYTEKTHKGDTYMKGDIQDINREGRGDTHGEEIYTKEEICGEVKEDISGEGKGDIHKRGHTR